MVLEAASSSESELSEEESFLIAAFVCSFVFKGLGLDCNLIADKVTNLFLVAGVSSSESELSDDESFFFCRALAGTLVADFTNGAFVVCFLSESDDSLSLSELSLLLLTGPKLKYIYIDITNKSYFYIKEN